MASGRPPILRASRAIEKSSAVEAFALPSTTLTRASGAPVMTDWMSSVASAVPEDSAGSLGTEMSPSTVRTSGVPRPKHRAKAVMSPGL